MITHDVIEAVLLADRIAVIHDGRLLGLGTPKALMTELPNAEVRALMDMPRRQAERLTALMRDGGAEDQSHDARPRHSRRMGTGCRIISASTCW